MREEEIASRVTWRERGEGIESAGGGTRRPQTRWIKSSTLAVRQHYLVDIDRRQSYKCGS